MKRTLPTGPIWDRAKVERNWMVFGITLSNNKVPVNARSGMPIDRLKAACLTFEGAAKATNGLKKKVGEINARIDAKNADRDPKDELEMFTAFELGYLPREGSAMVVIDLDKVRNPEEPDELPEWVRDMLGETYTEVSISGTGLHMLTARAENDLGVREKNQAGLYAGDQRGIVITLMALDDSPLQVNGAIKAREVVTHRIGQARKGKRLNLSALPDWDDQPPLSWIPFILQDLPNPTRDYDQWIAIGHALKAAAIVAEDDVANAIEQAFYEWSDRWSHGADQGTTLKAWASMRPTQTGPGAFYKIAKDKGFWGEGQQWKGKKPRDHLPNGAHDVDILNLKAAIEGDGGALRRLARALVWGEIDIVRTVAAIGNIAPEKAAAAIAVEQNTKDNWVSNHLEGADIRAAETAEQLKTQKAMNRAAKIAKDVTQEEQWSDFVTALRQLPADRLVTAFVEVSETLAPKKRKEAADWLAGEVGDV